MQAQRLVAFLALKSKPVDRHVLSEQLWPYTNPDRANANLRTALWRVRHAAPETLVASAGTICLDDRVDVDYRRLLDTPGPKPETGSRLDMVAQLRVELLPGWDEDWLTIERERSRQLRMRRLEHISQELLDVGRTADAIDAAFASIEIEPLRESAHLALIEAHVQDGNVAEAAHQAERLRALLRAELAITPSPQFLGRLTELGVT